MSRQPVFIALTALLASAAVACASDDDGSTPAGTGPTTPAPTPIATPIDAVSAVAAPDQAAYRQTITELGTVQETCTYMADFSVADCSERGIYRLDPPPAFEDASCVVGLSGGGVKPEYVLCSKPPAGERTYFVIQQ
jgi:hypothetical protein